MSLAEKLGIGGVNMAPVQSLVYNPQVANQQYGQNFSDLLNQISTPSVYGHATLPQFDYLGMANQLGLNTGQTMQQSAVNAAHNAVAGMNQQQQVQGTPRLQAILRALRSQESGGNYGAINKDSGALGAYQVMPNNIQGNAGWDYSALGHNITTDQFLHNQQLQNQIVAYQFGNYLRKYGLRGAISAWYSGNPNAWNSRDSQGNYPSVHDYVLQVLARLR